MSQATRSQSVKIQGAMTAMVTPFRGGEVDYARLKQNVEFQIAQGIDGLVPCGTTGESPTLNYDEHKQVITVAVEAAAGRAHVVMHEERDEIGGAYLGAERGGSDPCREGGAWS